MSLEQGGPVPQYNSMKAWQLNQHNGGWEMDRYVYNPLNSFCGLSLDKTDHVIQNHTMVIGGYPPSDLISVVWFYFDGRKTKKQANVQAKLLIGQEKPNKTFCRSQWRITKKLVDNSVPKNTKKIRKIFRNDLRAFALIYVRSPFRLAGISEDNALGWKIVLKISQLPSKLRFSAICSFFGQSFGLGHYPPIYQLPEGVYLLNSVVERNTLGLNQ